MGSLSTSSGGVRDRIHAFEARSLISSPPPSSPTTPASGARASPSPRRTPTSPRPVVQHPLLGRTTTPAPSPVKESREKLEGGGGSLERREGPAAQSSVAPIFVQNVSDSSSLPTSSRSTLVSSSDGQASPSSQPPATQPLPRRVDGLPDGQAQLYVHPLLRSKLLGPARTQEVVKEEPYSSQAGLAEESISETGSEGVDDYDLPTLSYGSPRKPRSAPSTTVVGSPVDSKLKPRSKPEDVVDDDEMKQPTPHQPVPAAKLFTRGSLPLVIAHLDAYLSSLPSPSFTPTDAGDSAGLETSTSKGQRKKAVSDGMFAPFDRLEGGSGLRKYFSNKVGRRRVRFGWARPKVLLETVTNLGVGAEGSAGVSSLYSLEGAYGAMQVVALVLTSIVTLGQSDELKQGWRKILLGHVPNLIALNFPSVFGQSIIFLLIFQVLALLLLWDFHREAKAVGTSNEVNEGFTAMRWTGWKPMRRARVMLSGFGLVILYLPMSTMAVHALVWSSDFWPVDINPYLENDDPVLPDGLKICYTTTNTGGANWAPLILIISIVSFCAVTVYFPLKLWWTIRDNLPHVDRYTELGRKRGAREEDREYRRVLDADENPLSFLYAGYRRRWGAYRAYYLLVKLSVLVIVAIFSKDNCLFRNVLPRATMEVIRQGVLLFFLFIWLAVQVFLKPFTDSNSNSSEVVSRSTYIAMTFVGLLVALDVRGSTVLNSWVMYFLMVISYGGNIWFTLVNFDMVKHFIQRRQKRLEWSIDIFSPHIDIEPWTSVHVKRRVWEETLSAVIMTSETMGMPPGKEVLYSVSREGRWPPFLVNFGMTVAERHAENLNILRELGSPSYYQALDLNKQKRWDALRNAVFPLGPDSYFRPRPPLPAGVTTFFGNAWIIPFPLTLVIRYDQCSTPLVLTEIDDLETYLEQNARTPVQDRRMLRAVLRSLEGQVVRWPFTSTIPRRKRPFARKMSNGQAPTIVTYPVGTLEIRRQGTMLWKGHQLGSGFDIRIRYAKNVFADAAHIGLTDELTLNNRLSTFLERNGDTIDDRLPGVLSLIEDYGQSTRYEMDRKAEIMSYGFLRDIYDKLPFTLKETEFRLQETEVNSQLQALVQDHTPVFKSVQERLHTIFRSRATCLWYLFWDDLWRRNNQAIGLLRANHDFFSPFYPTSIAYRPCSRSKLVTLLSERGAWPENGRRGFFGDHVLNLLFFCVNEAQFDDIPVHFGSSSTHHYLSTLPHALNPSSLPATTTTSSAFYSSAPATDYSSSIIMSRPAFEWEAAFLPARSALKYRVKGWLARGLGLGKYEGVRRDPRMEVDLEVEEQEVSVGRRYVPLASREEEEETSRTSRDKNSFR